MANIASAPYYDDFDKDSGFHQILFKPGLSVQSRELTQLQSILRDQISKFGGHIFKHGSVVIPGNSTADLNVCFVKLQNTSYDLNTLVGKDITSSISGLRGLIRAVIPQGTDPGVLYVSYYNSGTNGDKIFRDSDSLSVSGVATTFTTLMSGAAGGASMAFVNHGVFFINGTFVTVNPQSIVLADTAEPSCHVLLKIVETTVDSEEDSTLLDPAQGSYNYAAPGADRLKIELILTVLPLNTVFGDDYVELMRYDEGVLLEHSRYPKYNELEKSLARRTYDESGDYVVSGLEITPREHLKIDLNGGRYPAPTGDSSKLIYSVSPGKAYVQGFENESIATKELTVSKARTTGVTTANMVPSFGQFFYVSDVVTLPTLSTRESVTLYDAKSGGSSIGTARVIAIDYVESNTTDANAIYKIFVSDVSVTGGNTFSDVGCMVWSTGQATVLQRAVVAMSTATDFVAGEVVTSSTRVATVHKFSRVESVLYTFKHAAGSDIPVINDTLTAPSLASGKILATVNLGRNADDNMFVALPTTSTYRVKNSLNASDISYKIYYQTSVTITGGNGSFSVTGMTIDPKEQGNFIIASAAGLHPISAATVAVDGLSVSFSGISPASTTIYVVCAATKTGASGAPRTKTLVPAFSESGLTPASTVQLARADIVRLVSVVSTVDGDVTSRYTLDTGQRDYAYLRGSLILTGTAPNGTLTVTYDYFNHNAGSGDYFSVDSYESSGLVNYYSSPVLSFKSQNTGNIYDLRDVLDFRPRVGNDGTYTGTGASVNFVPQIDSRITTSIQEYLGRVDAVVMNRDGSLDTIAGTPSTQPKEPTVTSDVLYIATVTLAPYTYGISDAVVKSKNNRVYTMKDVGSIDKRLSNVEDFVLLSTAETSVVNMDIIDPATGLSRFKSGYLVDSFKDADKIADIYNPNFKVSYESENIIPTFEIIDVPLTEVSSTLQVTGTVATLPYTSVALAKQPLSSRVTNINPFSVFSWVGDMVLTPSADSWVEIVNLPPNYTSSTEYVTIDQSGRTLAVSSTPTAWSSAIWNISQ